MSTTADPGTGEIIETEDRHVRPFTDWLMEQREGACAVEMGEALNELVDSVNMLGKAGKVTLTIKIKPSSRGQNQIVLVTDEISLTKPTPEPEPAVFFIDKNSNLSRANPAQPSLPLREVPKPSDELKEVQP